MEKTSDLQLRIGVRGNTTSNITQPGDSGTDGSVTGAETQQSVQVHPAGGLADTGSPAVIMSSIALVLVVMAAICLFIIKKRKRWGVSQRDNKLWQIILPFGSLLIAAVSVWGVSVSATSSMNVTSSVTSANLDLNVKDNTAQTIQSSLQLAANSQTGYTLDAKLVDSNLPNGDVNLEISGGDVTQPATITESGTRLVTRKQPDSQVTVSVVIKATANAAAKNGDYDVKVRFVLKPQPATQQQIKEFPGIMELMAAPLQPGDLARTIDHGERNDQIRVLYKIASQLPSDPILSKISAPLTNGNYAVPQDLNTKLPAPNDPQKVEQLMEVAQTYADAGSILKWNPNKAAPLHTGDVVHKTQELPYALTCSSFVGMSLLSWKFNDTTYVADTNKASYSWGTTFERPAGTQPPFQAYLMLKWLYWNNRVAVHTPGVEDYKRGDILFFSQENPEGKGTDGKYFMNVYHTGIYMGNGKIIHSYSDKTPNGVMVENLSESLKKNLTFIARPSL